MPNPWEEFQEAPNQEPWKEFEEPKVISEPVISQPTSTQFDVETRLAPLRGVDPSKAMIQDPMDLYRGLRVPAETAKKGIDEIANLIPDPQFKSVTANVIAGLPETLGEIFGYWSAEMISPEALTLLFGGRTVTEGLKQPAVRKGIGDIVGKIPKGIKRALTYRWGQPEIYQEAAEQRLKTIAAQGEDIVSFGKEIMKQPVDIQRKMAQFMKGEIAQNELPEQAAQLAIKARDQFVRLGREAVDLGLLSEKVYRQNVGRYLPRMYRIKEVRPIPSPVSPRKPERIDLSRFKKRKDIPLEVRESMGEILEAGYPTTKGLLQLHKSIETARFFRQVARNPEWATANTDEAVTKGFKQMPEVRSLGELAGKYVHPEIADDLNQIIKQKDMWTKLWDSMLSKWKFGKVVMNPATHFRNMMSNSILADMGGMDPLQQIKYLPAALRQISKKGQFWKEAKDAGLLGFEFVGGELRAMNNAVSMSKGPILQRLARYSESMATRLQKAKTKITELGDKLGEIYQREEQVFKLAKFIQNRNAGVSIKEAAADAEKWLFNYAKVSPAVETLRRSPIGAPFITFTAKALPRIGETMVKSPIRLYKYATLFNLIEDKAREELGLTQDQMDTIKARQRGASVILPFRDKQGNIMVYDLAYTLPWGDIGETGGLFGLPPVAPPSGPLKAIAEIGFNKNTFTGREIYNTETDLPSEVIQKSIDHMAKALLPSLTPGIVTEESFFKGGYSFQSIIDALKGRPDIYGRYPDLPTVLAGTILGIKLRPVDPALIDYWDAKKFNRGLEDLKFQLKREIQNPKLSDKYKATLADKYLKKIDRLEKNVFDEDKKKLRDYLRVLQQQAQPVPTQEGGR